MSVKILPQQSPECVRDAFVVLEHFPAAEAYYTRKQNVVRIEDGTQQLGVGGTAESAWADAARNVTRKPVPDLAARGSDTWSLKSDEVFWKNKPRIIEPPKDVFR